MNVYRIMFETGRLLDKEVGLARGDNEDEAVKNFLDGSKHTADAELYYAVKKD